MLKPLLVALALIPMQVSPAYPTLRPQQMKCLTDNVYFEARGEPLKGQMLVARVTLNRAKEEFNGDICDAVYAKGQFSWTSAKKKVTDPKAYAVAAKAAYASLWYHKPAYYFHNKKVAPKWANNKTVVARIGNHVFYQ